MQEQPGYTEWNSSKTHRGNSSYQAALPAKADVIENVRELGILMFLEDADPACSAASTKDSALTTTRSLAATADSAADSAAEAALLAALRAAPKNPPPNDVKPGLLCLNV